MKKRFAYTLFFLATIIWGLAFVAQKKATVLPAFTVGAYRSGIAFIFLALILPLTDKITKNGRKLFNKKHLPDFNKSELIGGAILGVIISVATAFQQIGLESTSAGKSAFITTLYVVFVPLFSIILGEKQGLNVYISVPTSVIGFYFLCITPGTGINPADLLILGCAFIFSFHIIAVGKFSPKCDGVRMSLIQFAVSFLINTILALCLDKGSGADAFMIALPSLLFLGIGSSGIAYTLQIIGQKYSDASVASIILSLESVFGVIGSAIIIGERLSLREYIGCTIVFVAVIIAQISPESLKKLFKSKRK